MTGRGCGIMYYGDTESWEAVSTAGRSVPAETSSTEAWTVW